MNTVVNPSRRGSLLFFFIMLVAAAGILAWTFLFNEKKIPPAPANNVFISFLEKIDAVPTNVKPYSRGDLIELRVETKEGRSVLMYNSAGDKTQPRSLAFFDRPLRNPRLSFPASEKYVLVSEKTAQDETYYLVDTEKNTRKRIAAHTSTDVPIEALTWEGEWLKGRQGTTSVLIDPASLVIHSIPAIAPELIAEKSSGIFIFIAAQQAEQAPSQAGASVDEVLKKIEEEGSFDPAKMSHERFIIEFDGESMNSRTLVEVPRTTDKELEELLVDQATRKIYVRIGTEWFVLRDAPTSTL